MPLTPEQIASVTSELKRFGVDLNLSEEQEQRLHRFMSEAYEKLPEYKQAESERDKRGFT